MFFPKPDDLPQNLICNDGTQVTDIQTWETKRRQEIYNLFESHVYGAVPNIPYQVSSSCSRSEGENTIEYDVTITTTSEFGTHSFPAWISVPKVSAPCPAFLLIQFPYQETEEFKPKLMKSGYALARFYYPDVCTDDNNDFSTGIQAVIREPGERKPNTWGGVANWAWAASRLMDVIESIPEIDSSRVGIAGHSRTGKGALWAAASDQRFSMVFCNEAGCAGSAITRGKQGEHIANIVDGFPCWFCSDLKNYGDKEDTMPFDQHMLLALAAPRPLYVTSAAEDLWSGPEHELLSARYVSDVYALYQKGGLSLTEYPAPNTVDQGECVAYHLREGVHALNGYDWDHFIEYADKHLK